MSCIASGIIRRRSGRACGSSKAISTISRDSGFVFRRLALVLIIFLSAAPAALGESLAAEESGGYPAAGSVREYANVAFPVADAGMGSLRIYPVDHEIHELLAFVRGEVGLSEPWGTRRLTSEGVHRLLEAVDRGELSGAGSVSYDLIREFVHEAPLASDASGFRFGGEAHVAVQAYLNSAELPEAGDPYRWWQLDYAGREPIVALPLEAAFGRIAYGRLDFELRDDPLATERPDLLPATGYRTNVPVSLDAVNNHFPFRAFLIAGGQSAAIEIGRDALRWGPSETTSLSLSSRPHHYDYLRIDLGGDLFRYTGLTVALDPRLTAEERTRHGRLVPVIDGRLFVAGGELPEFAKTLILHRFEFAAGDRVLIALNEGLMLGNRRPDLRMLSPFLILHNLFEWWGEGRTDIGRTWIGSSFAGLEVSVMPVRGWTVYGEFGMQHLDTGHNPGPNALAALAGVRGRAAWRDGYFRPWAEIVHTTPWFGIRQHPRTTYHWRTRVVSNLERPHLIITEPIAEPPDTRRMVAGLEYRVPGRGEIGLQLERTLTGENRIDTVYYGGPQAVALRTPSGHVEVRHSATLRSACAASFLPGLRLACDLHLIHVSASGNAPGELLTDVQLIPTISYSRRF